MNEDDPRKDSGQRGCVRLSGSTITGLTFFKEPSCPHTFCPGFIKESLQKEFLPLL